MKSFLAALLLLATSVLAQTPSQKRPFTFEDMMKLKRVGAPVPSPDGKWVVFDCVDVDLEANTRISHLWIVPASGGESRRLNPTPNHEERPRFSPDGKRLIWTSKATDPTQIWMCDFDSGSGVLVGKPHQVTEISTGADGGIWSPDGKNIVFVSAVYPDCKDDACNKQRDEELKKSKVKAKIFSRLFYRHWSAFTEFKRSHLFVVSVDAPVAGVCERLQPERHRAGTATRSRDLTPGDHDVPPFSLGGQDMYAISPDGQEVAYTSNIDEVEATSTNNEIFVVPIAAAHAKENFHQSRRRHDAALFAGRKISRLAIASARRLSKPINGGSSCKIDNLGRRAIVTEKFDRSIGSFAWAPDSEFIWFSAEDHGEAPISYVDATQGKESREKWRASTRMTSRSDRESGLFFTRMSDRAPNEIYHLDVPESKGNATAVTHMNDALLSQIDMQPLESFTFKGANTKRCRVSWSSRRDLIRTRNIR